MPWTLLHTNHHHTVEHELEERGCILSSRQCVLETWRARTGAGPEDWPATGAELADARVREKDFTLSALKELAQMTATEKQCLDADIEAGLQELAGRFRRDPSIPEVPERVWEEAMHRDEPDDWNIEEWEFWQEEYPSLDAYAVQALNDACDNDLITRQLLFPFGAFFASQNWTDDELQQWKGAIKDRCDRRVNLTTGKMTRKKRAELLTNLTVHTIGHAQWCVNLEDLKHSAKTIKILPLRELQIAVEGAGITTADSNKKNDKATLVVALIEYIHDDVIEPAASALSEPIWEATRFS